MLSTATKLNGFLDRRTTPILVIVGLDRLGTKERWRESAPQGSIVFDRCERLLQRAREFGFPIAHMFQRSTRGAVAPERSWLRPQANEMVCEHASSSCYTCEHFNRLLAHIAHPTLVLTGLLSVPTLLGTALDAADRGHRLIVVDTLRTSFSAEKPVSLIRRLTAGLAEVVDAEDVLNCVFATLEPGVGDATR